MTLPLLGVGPTRTGGGALDPSTISGLTLYLDANDLTTLWQTNDTSTPVAASGDTIGRWLDKSATAGVLSQSTAGERPTWRNDQTGANGRGVLVTPAGSGAGSKWLDSAIGYASLYGAAQFTHFIVARSVTPGSSQALNADSSGLMFHRWPTSTTLLCRAWNGTFAQSEVTKTAIAGSTPYIFMTRRDATPNLLISANGGSEASTASAGNLSFGGTTLKIPTTQAGAKPEGWIGHVLIYNRSLTAAERNQVGQWLAGLYGLTWTDQ